MNFIAKLLFGAKVLCFLLNFTASSVMSYNDDQNDCFVCEQYDRCDECYEYDKGQEYPSYQKIKAYSGKYNNPYYRHKVEKRWRPNRHSEQRDYYRR